MEEVDTNEMPSLSKALHQALRDGSVPLTKLLLWAGASVNARDSKKRTALHWACASAQTDMKRIIEMLLRYGAEVNVQDCSGKTPLHEACWNLNQSVVDIMMEHGANIGIKDNKGRTPLHAICFRSWDRNVMPVAIALLGNSDSKKKDSNHLARQKNENIQFAVNLQTLNGVTALHLASENNNNELVSLLLRLGADVAVKDSTGMTALHWAVKACSENVVYTLVNNGADVNAKDFFLGNTPLHFASLNASEDIVRLLLSLGANVRARDCTGMTALHWASIACSEIIVDILVDYGADVNAKDTDGNTPLHLACSYNWYSFLALSRSNTIEQLLSKGANVCGKNRYNKTPYEQIGEDCSVMGATSLFQEKDKIEETFIKHTILRKTLNKQDRCGVTKWVLGLHFYEKVRKQCCRELEDIKSTEVVENVSLFKILSHKNHQFLLSPDDLLFVDKFLCSPDLLERFPLYGHSLRTSFQRPKLLTLAAQSFCSEQRKQMVKNLPYLVVEHLLKFLTLNDLRNFIKSQ